MTAFITNLREDRDHYHALWRQTRCPKWQAKAAWASRTLRSLGQ